MQEQGFYATIIVDKSAGDAQRIPGVIPLKKGDIYGKEEADNA